MPAVSYLADYVRSKILTQLFSLRTSLSACDEVGAYDVKRFDVQLSLKKLNTRFCILLSSIDRGK